MRTLFVLPFAPWAVAVALTAGCDKTNPDDFDAGPDATTVHLDAGGAGDALDETSSGFDAGDTSFSSPCPPCDAGTYCYGNVFLVTKAPPDDGGDAGDAGLPQFGFACVPLPSACSDAATCTCVGDADVPSCPGVIFCNDEAGVLVTCAQGGP